MNPRWWVGLPMMYMGLSFSSETSPTSFLLPIPIILIQEMLCVRYQAVIAIYGRIVMLRVHVFTNFESARTAI